MLRTVSAIYEHGTLRPSEPLPLKEHKQVNVTISDVTPDPAAQWLDHEYLAEVDAIDEPEPSLEQVRQALSKINGNLSADIRAERDAGR